MNNSLPLTCDKNIKYYDYLPMSINSTLSTLKQHYHYQSLKEDYYQLKQKVQCFMEVTDMLKPSKCTLFVTLHHEMSRNVQGFC